MADNVIQGLFNGKGFWIVVVDHANTKLASIDLMKIVLRRLAAEHPLLKGRVQNLNLKIRYTKSNYD